LNTLDIYAGGRTIWLGNQLEFSGIGSFSGSSSFTALVIGSWIMAEFLPKWFLLLDGNAGGFGLDNVSFTGSALWGGGGYRTTLFGVPSPVQAGYKVLNVNVDKRVAANVTLHGPFIGLTGSW
jgi:hypothetical protein